MKKSEGVLFYTEATVVDNGAAVHFIICYKRWFLRLKPLLLLPQVKHFEILGMDSQTNYFTSWRDIFCR